MIDLFVRSAKTLLLCCLLCTTTVVAAYAACSPYIGRATINEVDVHNQSSQAGPYYVEVKALDNSILSATPPVWDDWTLSICSEQGLLDGTPCRTGIPLSAGVLQGNWLVIDESIIQWDYLDLNSGSTHGMEILLYDGNNDVVDYLSNITNSKNSTIKVSRFHTFN